MKKIIFSILFFFSLPAFSQTLDPEGIFSSAGNHTNNYAQMSWTIGDNQTRMYKTTDMVLTQGFLQSRIIITSVQEFSEVNKLNFKLYPNPVSNILNIQKDENVNEDISLALFSIEGKLVLQKNFTNKSDIEEISFKGLENGIYFLEVFSRKKSFKYTYKVVFQN